MKRLNFDIAIKASPEKIWNVLWDDRTYRIWTSVFDDGSHYVTDWEEGGRILFLNGKGQGMYAIIKENRPYERMTFEHIGEILYKKEIPFGDPESPKPLESYTLDAQNGITRLRVEVDSADEYVEFTKRTFAEAFDKIKELSEAR